MSDISAEERVSQALLWLGFEDVEIGKKFSSEKFENNDKEALSPEITYSTKDNLIPKAVATQLIAFMENVLNYHQQLQEKTSKLKQKGEDNA